MYLLTGTFHINFVPVIIRIVVFVVLLTIFSKKYFKKHICSRGSTISQFYLTFCRL